MNRKLLVILGIVVIVIVGAAATILYLTGNLDQLDITPSFDPGNRYDSTNLNYMDVIYESQSDIYAFREGYSASTNCPWGFVHKGIDYFLNNGSKVFAAAPGQVEEINWRDNGEGVVNRFFIGIVIRFNQTIRISYNFEPVTQDPLDKDRQLAMFNVEEGDWVAIGEEIATFLYISEGAHIDFSIYDANVDGGLCPQPFFSAEGYTEIMSLIHSYHPGWDLCYL
ncbi:MAG: M23 family metallopeptidase [Promethearchaeota archaeon]